MRTLGVLSNPMLLWSIGVEVAFAAALIYLPPLQQVFGTAALPVSVLVLLVPCPILVWSADEWFRWWGRHRAARTRAQHHFITVRRRRDRCGKE